VREVLFSVRDCSEPDCRTIVTIYIFLLFLCDLRFEKYNSVCVTPYVSPVLRLDGRIGHVGICELLYVYNALVI
jgi:hypothetical protein